MNKIVKLRKDDCYVSKISIKQLSYELKDIFINDKKMIDDLLNARINFIETENFIYKVNHKNYYKIAVYIKYVSSLEPNNLKDFLEGEDSMWNNDKIIIHKDILEINKNDSNKFEFEFLGVEGEDGKEIKIWR